MVRCWAHARARFLGRDVERRVPAVCVWEFANSGSRVPLCADCVAIFTVNADKEPDLQARRIILLAPILGDPFTPEATQGNVG